MCRARRDLLYGQPCEADINFCPLHSTGAGWGGAAAAVHHLLQTLSTRRVHSLTLRGCLLALQRSGATALQRSGATALLPGGDALLGTVCAGLRSLTLEGHCHELLPLLAPHCTQLEELELITARGFEDKSEAADSLVVGLG